MTKAVKASIAAGIAICRIEIDKAGKIIIVAGEKEPAPKSGANEWDTV